MSVLGRDLILKAIDEGEIKITPFKREQVGPASIDLTLAPEIRFFNTDPPVIRICEETNYKDLTTKVVLKPGQSYTLLPGQSCLGITEEQISLPPTLCGILEGRSRFARLGLFVHITASFMCPGINNRQVLEIYNSSQHAFELVGRLFAGHHRQSDDGSRVDKGVERLFVALGLQADNGVEAVIAG